MGLSAESLKFSRAHLMTVPASEIDEIGKIGNDKRMVRDHKEQCKAVIILMLRALTWAMAYFRAPLMMRMISKKFYLDELHTLIGDTWICVLCSTSTVFVLFMENVMPY